MPDTPGPVLPRHDTLSIEVHLDGPLDAITSWYNSDTGPLASMGRSQSSAQPLGLDDEVRGRLDKRTMAADDLAQVGFRLGQIAFPGPEGQAYIDDALLAARRHQMPLQIKLHIGSAELEQLPWELAMITRGEVRNMNIEYIALQDWVSMVRCGPNGVRPRSAPFDIFEVDVLDSPEKLHQWTPRLRIEEIADDSLRAPEPCTLDRIVLRLGDRLQGCPIFYLLAHGHNDRRSGDAAVRLSDRLVSASEFEALFAEHDTQLAIIAACSVGTDEDWLGFGTTLSFHVPAVISMQSRVDARGAERFVTCLLEQMRDGVPLAQAVGEARREIEANSPFADWWVPILHCRYPEEVRFVTAIDPAPSVRRSVFIAPDESEQVTSLTVDRGTVRRGPAHFLT